MFLEIARKNILLLMDHSPIRQTFESGNFEFRMMLINFLNSKVLSNRGMVHY